ncbi:unnamed protein product [Albugo candida]|uniref:Uncharacterized protein n=1 Tax=Albugo candida TaxID=65357 RepID=A0A024G810_9STRA|nr:unnamed protein product [Albugo candida]|eukprot:CCI43001.1 unnamed protein product [Albugo candida]
MSFHLLFIKRGSFHVPVLLSTSQRKERAFRFNRLHEEKCEYNQCTCQRGNMLRFPDVEVLRFGDSTTVQISTWAKWKQRENSVPSSNVGWLTIHQCNIEKGTL